MKIKIGGATVNQIPIDWRNNSKNIIDAIQEAKNQGIKILCLPELCITGYGCPNGRGLNLPTFKTFAIT